MEFIVNNNQIANTFGFVTRQTLSSWEKGTSVPQEEKIKKLKNNGINVDRFIIPTIKKFQEFLAKPVTEIVTNNETKAKV